jgi:hypothetical protein
MTRLRPAAILALGAVAGVPACAPPPAPPSPDLVRALEARQARTPDDPEISLALATAYYGAGRYEAALPLLDRLAEVGPWNEEAALLQAFTLDTLGQDRAARARYQSLALTVGSWTVRRAIAVRLEVLDARIHAAELAEAVARGVWPGTDGAALGVLPLRYTGSDTSLRGLGAGFARYLADRMAVTDSGGADKVEFDRLLDLGTALRMADETLAESATAVRLGRMLGVRQVLQGTIESVDSLTLRVRAHLVDVASEQVVATVTADTGADALAAAGARLVAEALAARDGRTPDVPVMVAVTGPRAEALAAFGRGLDARVAGDLPGAAAAFERAWLYDPAWASARAARVEAARRLRPPPRVDPRSLAVRVDGPTRDALTRRHLHETAVAVAPAGVDVPEELSPDLLSLTGRKPVAEATGTAGPERAARSAVGIVIRLHAVFLR